MKFDSFAGVDGCRAGWLCVFVDSARCCSAFIAPGIAQLAERLPTNCAIGIDMPIGLPAQDARRAESAAREILGRRRSSVFAVPMRAAIEVARPDLASAANEIVHARGCKLSAQTLAIWPKIREVDAYLRSHRHELGRIFEVHPEVSFCLWNGGQSMADPKKTRTGRITRQALIEARWPDFLRDARSALPRRGQRNWALDDLHDAFAALWTAERIRHGSARSFPDPPETDREELPMLIFG
jgi:predicted RNase H-like nuclease